MVIMGDDISNDEIYLAFDEIFVRQGKKLIGFILIIDADDELLSDVDRENLFISKTEN
jgi:hypothetical protein